MSDIRNEITEHTQNTLLCSESVEIFKITHNMNYRKSQRPLMTMKSPNFAKISTLQYTNIHLDEVL
jgi:hypothetical protein